MTDSLETRLVEAGFLVLLAVAVAALHYSYSFNSPFPEHTGAPLRHDPLYNYVLVSGIAAAAYVATRVVCKMALTLLPDSIKCSKLARSGASVAAVTTGMFLLYLMVGSPALEEHVLVKWVARNWEQRGREDVEWCLRLLVFLLFCQVVLGVLVMIFRVSWWILDLLMRLLLSPLRYEVRLLTHGTDDDDEQKQEQEPSSDSELDKSVGRAEGVLPSCRDKSHTEEEREQTKNTHGRIHEAATGGSEDR